MRSDARDVPRARASSRFHALSIASTLAFVLLPRSASAQEIQLSGPLADASSSDEYHYLPVALRGDLAFESSFAPFTPRARSTRAEGASGALRWRRSGAFAWEATGGLLRGVEDGSEVRVPVSLRAIFIDASRGRRDWELFLAAGASYEHVRNDAPVRSSLLGAEIGFGVDRRVDPVFNRFIVELVVADRRALDTSAGWVPAAMLRVGIATTFGITQYVYDDE